MKCSTARKNVLLWSDGEAADAILKKAVDGHLAQCESCIRWREYLRVLEDGAEDAKIPPFEMSSQVAKAIQTAGVRDHLRFAPSLRLGAAVVLGVLVIFAGISLLVLNNPWEKVREEWVQVDGQKYHVVQLDPSASFDPDYLKPLITSALQSDIRRQLGFLTDSLAFALRNIDGSRDWEALREALAEQKIILPDAPPEFLALSKRLTEVLQTDARDAELWVIQPTDSVLLFTLVGDEKW